MNETAFGYICATVVAFAVCAAIAYCFATDITHRSFIACIERVDIQHCLERFK